MPDINKLHVKKIEIEHILDTLEIVRQSVQTTDPTSASMLSSTIDDVVDIKIDLEHASGK